MRDTIAHNKISNMRKELKYGGYSASPSDHETLEGDLAVAMNLIPEHNTIRPVLPPKVIAPIPGDPYNQNDKGRKILCIHQTSAFKHFIVAVKFSGGGSPNHPDYFQLYSWDGAEDSALTRIGSPVAFGEIHSVEPVGNTLVVLAGDGVHYFLWKGDDMGYIYLGKHFPETHINFNVVPLTTDDGPAVNRFLTTSGYFSIELSEETATTSGDGRQDAIKSGILGARNRFVAEMRKLGYYTDPFIIRYAYRLYDGSLVMHSAPIYIGLEHFYNMYITINNIFTRDKFNNKMYFDGWVWIKFFNLYLDVVENNENLDQWKDIIKSVDFFMSSPIHVYEQDYVAEPSENTSKASMDMLYPGLVNDTWTGPFSGNILCYGNFNRNYKFEENVRDCSTFYLCRSIKLENLSSPSYFYVDEEARVVDSLLAREAMSDDYRSHDLLRAHYAFAYNNRLNLASVSRVIADSHNPASLFCGYNTNSKESVQVAFHIKKNGLTEIVVSGEAYNLDSVSPMFYLFHANSNTFKATIKKGNRFFEVDMKPHDFLNGSVFVGTVGVYDFDPLPEATLINQLPASTEEDEREEQLNNQIYTSEVNNPFYFPSTSINSVGNGDIIGISAAVRPVSTGQVGYADLYIFTDSGIWVAKINEKGTYSSITLVAGDVCINPDSITQTETSVLFTTKRGIMLISGSTTQCISGTIDDDGSPAPGLHDITDELAPLIALPANIKPFHEFLGTDKDNGCRMIYDYRGQRIIAYNPTTCPVDGGFAAVFPYAYIYSLESNKWGMMQSNISYSVRAFPDALAVNNNGELINCSVGDGFAVVNQLLITRPLTLDYPDVLKTIRVVLQRGLFRKHQEHVQSVLYGSRDLYNWHLVMSSTDENMRGRSGTPYKWFRVSLILHLPESESIEGCSIEFENKYTNRLR